MNCPTPQLSDRPSIAQQLAQLSNAAAMSLRPSSHPSDVCKLEYSSAIAELNQAIKRSPHPDPSQG